MDMFRPAWERVSREVARPLRSVSPNVITTFTLLLGVLAAFLLFHGKYWAAGVTVLLTGIVDLLDGAVAKKYGKKTKFGAIYDATVDRLSEGFIYAAAGMHHPLPAFLALIFSYSVSYVRAKNDRIRCGIMTRGDRVLVMGLLTMVGLVPVALWIIALLSAVTTVQRLAAARKLQ